MAYGGMNNSTLMLDRQLQDQTFLSTTIYYCQFHYNPLVKHRVKTIKICTVMLHLSYGDLLRRYTPIPQFQTIICTASTDTLNLAGGEPKRRNKEA